MDTIPTQGTYNKMPHIRQNVWLWALGIIVVIIVLWLWVSWRAGTFPFTPPLTAAQQAQQAQNELLRSLTAKPSSAGQSAADNTALLNSLTATTSSTGQSAADNTALLNSLTVKK